MEQVIVGHLGSILGCEGGSGGLKVSVGGKWRGERTSGCVEGEDGSVGVWSGQWVNLVVVGRWVNG